MTKAELDHAFNVCDDYLVSVRVGISSAILHMRSLFICFLLS